MPTSFMISTHLYLYKHVLNDMGIHLSKKRKKLKYLKLTLLSNYLTMMKQKIKPFEDKIIQKKFIN
jgi:hypothetical protein